MALAGILLRRHLPHVSHELVSVCETRLEAYPRARHWRESLSGSPPIWSAEVAGYDRRHSRASSWTHRRCPSGRLRWRRCDRAAQSGPAPSEQHLLLCAASKAWLEFAECGEHSEQVT